MMNISPMVNSVKCTVFSRFVQFSHGLEGSTANEEYVQYMCTTYDNIY